MDERVGQLDSGRIRAETIVLLVIASGTALRLLLAATIGMSVDESYAVSVARRLDLAYFDHSPLSFWIPGITARLLHTENAVVMRLPFILLFAGTTWLMFRLGARLFDRRAGAYAALALNVAPVFSVSDGGWVLPDGPLIFFMLAAALCLARIFFDQPGPARPMRWWLAAGVATGLALLSKYHGAFLPLGVLLFVVATRERRRCLATPGPYVAAGVAALLFLPVVVWNARHDWVSFRFQLGRGGASGGIHALAMLQNLGGQMGYLLPWIWVPLVWLLARALARGPREERAWFLACLAIGPIALFNLVSLGGKPGLPHWPMPGYLMLFPLLGGAIADRLARPDRARGTRRWLGWAVATFLVILALVATQTATGWMTRAAPSLFRRGDPTLEAVDWRDLRPYLAARGLLDRPDTFVAATSWIEAGKTSYALGPGVPVLCLSTNPHQFGYQYDQRAFLGQDAVLVDRTRGSSDADRRYAPYFASIRRVGMVSITRGGRPALDVTVFLARAFRRPYPSELPP